MKKYNPTKKDNGKWLIERVPIFECRGEIRGFNYDTEWGKRVVSNMQKLAKGGYLPSIFIGHGGGWDREKPICGYLANIRLEGKTLYADFDNVFDDVVMYDLERYPNRSIEVHEEKAEIAGLALLGASEPYFHFPQMFCEDGSSTHHFTDGETLQEWNADDGEKAMPKWVSDLKDWFMGLDSRLRGNDRGESGNDRGESGNDNGQDGGTATAGTKEGVAKTSYDTNAGADEEKGRNGVRPYSKENNQEPGGDKMKMSREEFKAEFGMYPEEVKENSETAKKFAALQASMEEKDKAKFAADMQAMNVSPAASQLFGEYIDKCDDKEAARSAFSKIVSMAKENTLMVPLAEEGRRGGKDKFAAIDPDDEQSIVNAIEKYMAEKNCSWGEASKVIYQRMDADAGGNDE